MKKSLRKRQTKQGAWDFTNLLLNPTKMQTKERKKPWEPIRKGNAGETSIQSSILDYLLLQQAQGLLFFQRTNNTPIYDQSRQTYRALPKGAQKGFPDIFVMKNARAIFFEVKGPKGTQSPHQVQMQSLLEKQGAEYYIVRSVDYVIKALSR